MAPLDDSVESRNVMEHESADRNDQPHDSDDEPMVYRTPRDYASWARKHREELIRDGADPATVILQSEVRNHVPRRTSETSENFTKRYVDTMNDMIQRGVQILNDQCVADVKPNGFSLPGRYFDVGPKAGTTKGEYRDFTKWFESVRKSKEPYEVPERFRRFEKSLTEDE